MRIDALTSVAGFQLGFVGGTLELLGFGVGLDLDGALDLLEHHGENEHDAEGGKPGWISVVARFEDRLLPFEDVLKALVAEDVEEGL